MVKTPVTATDSPKHGVPKLKSYSKDLFRYTNTPSEKINSQNFRNNMSRKMNEYPSTLLFSQD